MLGWFWEVRVRVLLKKKREVSGEAREGGGAVVDEQKGRLEVGHHQKGERKGKR